MSSFFLTQILINIVFLIYVKAFFLGNSRVCFQDLDCFTKDAPFTNTLGTLPESPDEIHITLKLFNRINQDQGRQLVYNDPQSIQDSGYDSSKPLKVIIHGYMGNGEADWVLTMKNELLKKGDFNVMTVDWQSGASKVYNQAVANTRTVGAVVARMINVLKDDYSCDPATVHVIGHSLGAQTSGYIGTRVPGLGRITGLDPAGPLFENYSEDVKLDPSDALFVDVIHTDAVPFIETGFGTKLPCGHVDFFPNSGHHQPGCPAPVRTTAADLLSLRFSQAFNSVACSHQRCYWLFIESIMSSCNFTAVPCKSADDFQSGQCTGCGNGPCPVMGYDADKTSQRGTFYLTTNDKSPFCKSSS